MDALSEGLLSETGFADLLLDNKNNSIRIEGNLCDVPKSIRGLMAQLYDLCKAEYAKSGAQDFRVSMDGVGFRVVAINSTGNELLFVLRKLSEEIYSWQDLRFSTKILNAILNPIKDTGGQRGKDHKPQKNDVTAGGVILISGETDSGKSTTANSIVHEIAQRKPWFVMCFEDPIETFFTLKYETNARIVQIETPSHDTIKGLKNALRANVDVIRVGEIRDEETAELVASAAISGHTVIATIHASNISNTLARYCSLLGNKPQLVADSLRCCIHQTLSKGDSFQTRNPTMTYLGNNNPRARNLLIDMKLIQLNQEAASQTTNIINGVG